MIGDTPFDSTLQDGYSEYAVTHEPARYREGDAGDYKDPATWVDGSGERHYAKHVLLTVHNRPDGDVGKITVTKLFASIDGKKLEKIDGTYTFALYEFAGCSRNTGRDCVRDLRKRHDHARGRYCAL